MTRGRRKKSARELLAENLRRLREATALSQEALAEKAGFHRTYVSQVERCKSNVTLDNLERLAHRLDVPIHELLIEHLDALDAA